MVDGHEAIVDPVLCTAFTTNPSLLSIVLVVLSLCTVWPSLQHGCYAAWCPISVVVTDMLM